MTFDEFWPKWLERLGVIDDPVGDAYKEEQREFWDAVADAAAKDITEWLRDMSGVACARDKFAPGPEELAARIEDGEWKRKAGG